MYEQIQVGRYLSGKWGAVWENLSLRLALFGDSLSERNSINTATNNVFDATGYLTNLNYLSYHRYGFDHGLNKGIAGNTTAQMIARLSDLDNLSCDAVIVLAGINDLRLKVPGATVQTNLQTIYDYITGTLGKQIIAGTIMPRDGWSSLTPSEIITAEADMLTVNDWIRGKASDDIQVVDFYAVRRTEHHGFTRG